MAIIVFQHSPVDTIGLLGPALRDRGHRLDFRRLDQLGAAGVPVDFDGVDAVIVLGGPQNVGDASPFLDAEMDYLRGAHARQLAIVGICLGHQLVAAALGGEVGPAAKAEIGFVKVASTPPGQTDTILAGIPWNAPVFQSHAHEVKKAPPDSTVLQSSPDCKVQSFRVGLRTYGFQYHFECDAAAVENHLATPFATNLISTLGLSAADIRARATEHSDVIRRVSDRLCANIGSFMFPGFRKARV
jgi:GMP synthase-like glutamine amidotransferase